MSIEDELLSAVKDGDKSKIEFLLGENSAYIYAKDEQGNTLLHIAVLHRHYDIISLLIGKKIQTDVQNYFGWTPLHSAVLLNDFAMVNILLELCLRPDIADTKGNLPIHLAAEMGCAEIIELLYGDKDTINRKNKHGFTPLHLAVQKEYKEAIVALICGGADLDIQDGNEKGETVLIMAVKKNNVSIVKLLLEYGADYNKTNNAGETFGAFATSAEMLSIVSKYDEFKNLSIPSTSGFSSHKRKTLSDISNTSSSSSSDKAQICKRRKAIDETPDVSLPMLCATDCSMHKNEEFAETSSTSSSEPKIEACAFKRRNAIDELTFLAYRYNLPDSLDDSCSIFSKSKSIESTDTLDISPPRSDISEPLASGCKNTLQALNLHYSAPNSPKRTKF